MTPLKLILVNFEETRRRSLIIWRSIPEEFLSWKPDKDALSCIEMVRHVLDGEYEYLHLLKGETSPYRSPYEKLPLQSVEDEISFSLPLRKEFLDFVKGLNNTHLEEMEIVRPEKNQRRKLGDYLLRIAYHDSVHAGQLLSYLRTLNVERPTIWD